MCRTALDPVSLVIDRNKQVQICLHSLCLPLVIVITHFHELSYDGYLICFKSGNPFLDQTHAEFCMRSCDIQLLCGP